MNDPSCPYWTYAFLSCRMSLRYTSCLETSTMKNQTTQKPTPFTSKEVKFQDATIVVAKRESILYVDLRSVCSALQLTVSGQLFRLNCHNKVVEKTYFKGRLIKVLSLEDAQWWLNTIVDKMVNEYAAKHINMYRKGLIPFIEKAFPNGEVTPFRRVGGNFEHLESTSKQQATTEPESKKVDKETFGRMEENRKLRDEALILFHGAEEAVKKYQDLINTDMAKLMKNMVPDSKTFRWDLLQENTKVHQ